MVAVASNLHPYPYSVMHSHISTIRTQRYKSFHFREPDIAQVIRQILKAIELAEWLAKDAENELHRFLEFSKWFKSGKIRCLRCFSPRHLINRTFYAPQKVLERMMEVAMSCAPFPSTLSRY